MEAAYREYSQATNNQFRGTTKPWRPREPVQRLFALVYLLPARLLRLVAKHRIFALGLALLVQPSLKRASGQKMRVFVVGHLPVKMIQTTSQDLDLIVRATASSSVSSSWI